MYIIVPNQWFDHLYDPLEFYFLIKLLIFKQIRLISHNHDWYLEMARKTIPWEKHAVFLASNRYLIVKRYSVVRYRTSAARHLLL
jgi:hypothetical protein